LTAERIVYADASALAKLAVEEAESAALRRYLASRPTVYTSRLAFVEVVRAARVAGGESGASKARQILDGCELIEVETALLDRAAALADARLRTLDAIHLASALRVGPDEVLSYDRRLVEAAEAAGLAATSPGA
jgi:predicted nucleic acid-binding protein